MIYNILSLSRPNVIINGSKFKCAVEKSFPSSPLPHVRRRSGVFCTLPNLLLFPSRSYLKRKGVVVNETTVLLYGQLLTGRKYVPKANGVVELEKQWSKQVLPLAYQTVVKVMLLRAE